jgi:hypothetical protein
MRTVLCGVTALLLLSGCGAKQAAIDEVQFGVTSASAVGRAAALAMDGIKGTSSTCVVVTTACTAYPCTSGAVTITLGSGCPLPLGGVASGSITVTGNWSNADQATLSQIFVNTQVASAQKALAVASVTQITASRSGNTLTVQYTGENAAAGASGSAVAVGAADSWTVAIDNQGTPDPGDDVLTVNASSAAGGGLGGARVTTITGAVLSPSCTQNPTAGSADITTVSGGLVPIPTITKVVFHSACDGKAEVDGSTVDLQLLP